MGKERFRATAVSRRTSRSSRPGDDWSVVNAFRASDGTPIWKNDKLKNRRSACRIILGRAVVVGDFEGYRAFPERPKTANSIGRAKTDGSAITAAPVLAGDTLVVQTHDGDLYGFRPALICRE